MVFWLIGFLSALPLLLAGVGKQEPETNILYVVLAALAGFILQRLLGNFVQSNQFSNWLDENYSRSMGYAIISWMAGAPNSDMSPFERATVGWFLGGVFSLIGWPAIMALRAM
jgi:hypothetical protein